MKNVKLAVIAGLALVLGACSNNPVSKVLGNDDISSLRAAVEDARNAAIQANENAQYARQLAEQNAEKINSGYRRAQHK